MKLVIVESPTKAVTISKFLGKEYRVESSYGHVRDLPRSRFGIDLEHNFEPTYIIPIKARKRVTELKKLAEKSSAIILASDEDREGEAIAWHVRKVLENGTGKKADTNPIAGKPVSRIVFHEITKPAIERALASPRDLDINLVNAQQARRILDRIVGYKLSPFLWEKIAKGLSAGRVQSVALRLIVDRENEIKQFKPEEYWTIEALLQSHGLTQMASRINTDKKFSAELVSIGEKKLEKFDLKTNADVETIVDDLKSANYQVSSVKQTEVKRHPLPPFTTSTLQQEASRRLHYPAKRTMMLAQNLYENGLITYMRTDSVNLSSESVAAARGWLESELGKEYALATPRIFTTKSKLAQEAHEAIRPTTMEKPEQISVAEEAQRKLYTLIWQRFVASQMPEAIFDATSVEIAATNNKKLPITNYQLRANGNVLKFDGFLKIYPQTFEQKELPQLTENEALKLNQVTPLQHFTEPPARFSEASLIKALEEFGIGRPSTYVPIISVIQARNYVKKDAGRFIPTEIGELVNKLLVAHFPEIVDIGFTADMEEKLDRVAEGQEKWQELLRKFYDPFEKNLEQKYITVAKEFTDEKTDQICEKCGKPMVIKFGRFGKFLACTGFPECKNTKNLGANAAKPIGMKCPKCLASPDPAKRDNPGEVVEKYTHKGRRKMFWGCNRYPECDWASWQNPKIDKTTNDERPTTKEPQLTTEDSRQRTNASEPDKE